MKYTLYLRSEGIDSFLQKAETVEDLQKSHATVVRWIGQMNLVVTNAHSALLVIAESDRVMRRDRAILEARYVSGTRRVWRPIPADVPGSVIRAIALSVPSSPVSVKTGAWSEFGAVAPSVGDSLGA